MCARLRFGLLGLCFSAAFLPGYVLHSHVIGRGIENWEVFRKLLAFGVVEVEGLLAFVEVGRRKNVFCGFC